ncbi:MAG: ribonuclease HII [Bacteroidia bacterium]
MLKTRFHKDLLEAGCDEAGRGCLAGPVFAAAVILPETFKHHLLDDSKKMSDKHRKELRPLIEEQALAWAVGIVEVAEIDEINILQASFLAMHRAITGLRKKPEHLLIDGNRFKPYPGIPHTCIIGGDGKYKSIASASVLAKTYRDDYMDTLHESFPDYHWLKNKGYGTLLHRDAIRKHGATDHHRKTFQLLPAQLKITF